MRRTKFPKSWQELLAEIEAKARTAERERIRQHIQTMYDEARSNSERGSRAGVDKEVIIWFDRQAYSLGKVLEWLDV